MSGQVNIDQPPSSSRQIIKSKIPSTDLILEEQNFYFSDKNSVVQQSKQGKFSQN